jgi:hypothetical protein
MFILRLNLFEKSINQIKKALKLWKIQRGWQNSCFQGEILINVKALSSVIFSLIFS